MQIGAGKAGVFAAALVSMALAFMAQVSEAAIVADVELPDSVTVGGEELVLNGAGLRTKFGFKVYAGALYLPARAYTSGSAVRMDGPKRITMHFIYKNSPGGKLVKGWREGFRNNLTIEEQDALHSRIDRFCDLFGDTSRGETYTFDYIPGLGTQVYQNGRIRTTIEGDDFMRALMLIWLGKEPAQESLKRAMLGGGD